MHSLFLPQQSMEEFRQLPVCHLQSWRCGLRFLANCSSRGKDFEPGMETQDNYCNSEIEFYQWEAIRRDRGQEDHFCHITVQTSDTQGLLQRSPALLRNPGTAI